MIVEEAYVIYHDDEYVASHIPDIAHELDFDEDGKIERHEFQALVSMLSGQLQLPMNKHQTDIAFHMADHDDTGDLSHMELLALIQFIIREMIEAFVQSYYELYMRIYTTVEILDQILADPQNIRDYFQAYHEAAGGEGQIQLSEEDFKQALRDAVDQGYLPFNEDDIQLCFEIIDEDGSNVLTGNEVEAFIHLLEALKEYLQQLLEVFHEIFPEDNAHAECEVLEGGHGEPGAEEEVYPSSEVGEVEVHEGGEMTKAQRIIWDFKTWLEAARYTMYTLYYVAYNPEIAAQVVTQVGAQFDVDGSQRIELDEFKELVNTVAAEYSAYLTDDEIEATFHAFDADYNGGLDIHEGTALVQAVCKEFAHTIADALYHHYTYLNSELENLGATIDNEEAIADEVNSWFQGKDSITWEEFRQAIEYAINQGGLPFTVEQAEATFDQLDTNNNQELSQAEVVDALVEWLTSVENLVHHMVTAYKEVFATTTESIEEQEEQEVKSEQIHYYELQPADKNLPTEPIEQFRTRINLVKDHIEEAIVTFHNDDYVKQFIPDLRANFDKDANGKLERHEFAALVDALSEGLKIPMNQHQVNIAYHMADHDDNGQLDDTEFLAVLQFIIREMIEAYIQSYYELRVRIEVTIQALDNVLNDPEAIHAYVASVAQDGSYVSEESFKATIAQSAEDGFLPLSQDDIDMAFEIADADSSNHLTGVEISDSLINVLEAVRSNLAEMLSIFHEVFAENDYLEEYHTLEVEASAEVSYEVTNALLQKLQKKE